MKSILKTSTVSAFIFAIFMTIFFYFIFYGKIAIVEIFLFCFLGWGILIFIFLLFMSKKNDKIVQNFDGEVFYKGLANHFVGIEGVGGHLFITKDKIMFKSHSFNVQNHSIEIPLTDILEIKTYNNLGIIPNGLTIVQKDKTDKFVVNDRKKIIEILNTLIP
jgi:energy-coupling factor transporter transmembrane protein EcfT